ncbi:DUF2306 domain-containing protein [Pseudoalteromonas sp. A22]|uniref:DUF2306 domain-containing protein n=1 Tax=Pseudoalteromonas sp. A22 TaxID=327511 RepID=UPI001BAA93FF|nr:DUF2306 domain-containing protein [Pseudoalteromonas sp. A22]QUI62627.1 DUF2306 domain-containing protein [Pseudoalteromonas sp. A22]
MKVTTARFGLSNEQQSSASATTQTRLENANKLLKYSAIFWFSVILAGQWFFFYYIIKFYGMSVINDNMEIWNRWEPMGNTPHKAGDIAGNMLFFVHVMGAGIVAFGGALQLLPKVRAVLPTFHKINGYTFLVTVFFLAISGFYLSWVRGASPNLISEIGTSINGFLILGFAYMTVKTAISKDIANHRKWAIRLFLVSNAQWFLRVGVFSYFITSTAAGVTPAFGDPFFPMWTFGCFLLPLAAAQLYFYGSQSKRPHVKVITSFVLVVLTVLMSLGIVGFTPFLLQIMSGEPIAF